MVSCAAKDSLLLLGCRRWHLALDVPRMTYSESLSTYPIMRSTLQILLLVLLLASLAASGYSLRVIGRSNRPVPAGASTLDSDIAGMLGQVEESRIAA